MQAKIYSSPPSAAAVSRALETSLEVESSLIPEWKRSLDSAALSNVRVAELGEMAKDVWSPRPERYHLRRKRFVTKKKPDATPRRFALHRKNDGGIDEEDDNRFDIVQCYVVKGAQQDDAKKLIPGCTISEQLRGHSRIVRGQRGRYADTLYGCYYATD